MFLEHLWISEDQRFFQHEGFDWKEMDLAVEEAARKGKPVRGASTITNQCARSIFLWQGRSWIRKAEIVYRSEVVCWLNFIRRAVQSSGSTLGGAARGDEAGNE